MGILSRASLLPMLFPTARLKENIRPTAKGLTDLMRIQVSDFNFKSKPGGTETGFIAKQLYTVLRMPSPWEERILHWNHGRSIMAASHPY
jgi:hypothetical protein